MELALAILHLYPEADPHRDFIVQNDNDGNGDYVAQWNLDVDKPTEQQLSAAWDEIKGRLPPSEVTMKTIQHENELLDKRVSETENAILTLMDINLL